MCRLGGLRRSWSGRSKWYCTMDIAARSDTAHNEAAFRLVGLPPLMDLTPGAAAITVALIDGPVGRDHPDLAVDNIRVVSATAQAACLQPESVACTHDTYVAGMLHARRDSKVRGICPGCAMVIRPIFSQTAAMRETDAMPNAALPDLAPALHDVIAAGARIINLSVGLEVWSRAEPTLDQALEHRLSTATSDELNVAPARTVAEAVSAPAD
jgi:subtilisin family serine protease